MLNLLDESLETFLRAEVPLPPRSVDVSFEPPDSDWSAGVTKPTIDLYLWDVRRSAGDTESGFEIVEDEDGKKSRRAPKPRVDCRYLITAWTSEIHDEHALLGQVLASLLTHDYLPERHLADLYAKVRPLPTLSVASSGAQDQSDFWSALGGQLKPGLDLVVTATVDAGIAWEVGPPVDRYRIAIKDTSDDGLVSESAFVGGRAEGAAGTTVWSPRGSAALSPDGEFLVRANRGDKVTVDAEPGAAGKVPKKGPVLPT